MVGKRVIVGCGPGAADMITVRGLRAIEDAKCIAGSMRLLETFASSLNVPKYSIAGNYGAVLDAIDEKFPNVDVVFLVSGDPLFFSLGEQIVKRYGKERCEIIPGISSVQYAASRIGESWKNIKSFTLHGGVRFEESETETENALFKKLFAAESELAFLMDKKRDPEYIKNRMGGKLPSDYEYFLCQNLSSEEESVKSIEPQEFENLPVASLSLLIALKREPFSEKSEGNLQTGESEKI